MTTVLNALFGGLVSGLVAVIATRLLADGPSAPTLSGGDAGSPASSSRWKGPLVRLSYAGFAGGTLLALELSVLGILAVPPSTIEAFGVAVAWSTLLFGVLGVARWIGVPGSFGRSDLGELFVFHLVYAVGFGLWIRLTWIT